MQFKYLLLHFWLLKGQMCTVKMGPLLEMIPDETVIRVGCAGLTVQKKKPPPSTLVRHLSAYMGDFDL